MVESVRVPGIGIIRSSTEKLSDELQKIVESVSDSDNSRIRANTRRRLNLLEYQKTIG